MIYEIYRIYNVYTVTILHILHVCVCVCGRVCVWVCVNMFEYISVSVSFLCVLMHDMYKKTFCSWAVVYICHVTYIYVIFVWCFRVCVYSCMIWIHSHDTYTYTFFLFLKKAVLMIYEIYRHMTHIHMIYVWCVVFVCTQCMFICETYI